MKKCPIPNNNTNNFKHERPTVFSNKVLIGNWFEEKLEYQKQKYNHNSTYRTDFTSKHVCSDEAEQEYRDIISKGEGAHSVYPTEIGADCPNYNENFTTTYDLSYNHFPVWFGDTIYRKMRFRLLRSEPTEEYIHSYGNLTKTGLTEYKNAQWKCEKVDPRFKAITTTEDSFCKPEKSLYDFFRWNLPTAIKVRCGRITEKVNRPYPPFHPSFTNCNPITWECKVPENQPQRCVENEYKKI